jgi:hypothetical protein
MDFYMIADSGYFQAGLWIANILAAFAAGYWLRGWLERRRRIQRINRR